MTALSTAVNGLARRAGAPLGALLPPLGVAALSLAVGWAIAGPNGPAAAGVLLGVTTVALLVAWNLGVAVGLIVLTVLNGIPGLDVDEFHRRGSFRLSDLVILALVLVLAAVAIGARDRLLSDPWLRAAGVWAALFLSWWLFTVLRTVLLQDVPALQAILFGRDFLYFGLLVPLFVAALRRRAHVLGLLATLGAGTLLYALAQIQLITGVPLLPVDPDWFVHEFRASNAGAIPRIYALMSDAVTAALPLLLGVVVMGRTIRFRLAAGVVTLVIAVSMLLQLTRATYIGVAVGLLVVALVWSFGAARSGRAVRRSVSVLAGVLGLVLAVAVIGGYRPTIGSDSTAGVVSTRVVSGFEELSAGSGTVQYRYNLVGRMGELLEGRWVEGLGFLHPSVRPIPGLPSGSIRNADVGVMNSVMTMGLLGTALLYLPFVALGRGLIRAGLGRLRAAERDGWLLFGGLAWLVATLVGSLTLITLFSVSGLVLTAALLACLVRVLAPGTPEEADAR